MELRDLLAESLRLTLESLSLVLEPLILKPWEVETLTCDSLGNEPLSLVSDVDSDWL